MKLTNTLIIVLSLATVAICSALTAHVALEARPFELPAGWSLVGRSHPNKPIKLQIAIKQSNVDRLKVHWLFYVHN